MDREAVVRKISGRDRRAAPGPRDVTALIHVREPMR
ncbi:hypothetical protein GZL_07734 [Streptomyces sp. 769]|nr:hypothetical protein GZL_07734 [Streptomyces sp. 769]